jgi:helix-turn-helix protein
VKITKKKLRRIIKEEKAKLLEQPRQLSFNSSAADEVDEIANMLADGHRLYMQAEFPGVDHDRLNDLEDRLIDFIAEFVDIAEEIKARGLG